MKKFILTVLLSSACLATVHGMDTNYPNKERVFPSDVVSIIQSQLTSLIRVTDHNGNPNLRALILVLDNTEMCCALHQEAIKKLISIKDLTNDSQSYLAEILGAILKYAPSRDTQLRQEAMNKLISMRKLNLLPYELCNVLGTILKYAPSDAIKLREEIMQSLKELMNAKYLDAIAVILENSSNNLERHQEAMYNLYSYASHSNTLKEYGSQLWASKLIFKYAEKNNETDEHLARRAIEKIALEDLNNMGKLYYLPFLGATLKYAQRYAQRYNLQCPSLSAETLHKNAMAKLESIINSTNSKNDLSLGDWDVILDSALDDLELSQKLMKKFISTNKSTLSSGEPNLKFLELLQKYCPPF